jgi:beta-galactosidase/beta-glucuronidase
MLSQNVTTWKGSKAIEKSVPQVLELAPGEEKTITQTIPIPGAHLWSPEDPFLYVVETSTGGDAVRTLFGMREFRFTVPRD